MDIPLSYISVLVAAVASFAFGFLVHGPLFGKQWMSLMKITPQQMEEGKKEMQGKMQYYLLAAFVQQLVVAYVLAHFVYLAYASNIMDAVVLAFWVWLGFIATTLLNGVLWEKRTPQLYAFNVAYHLASLIIMSVILTLGQ